MARAIAVLCEEIVRRGGSLVATSETDPVARVAVLDGRFLRAEIDGEAPISLRVPEHIKAAAAAAVREERPLESLGPEVLNAIRRAHFVDVVETLARVDALLGDAPHAWDFRPTMTPPRIRALRGHPVAAIIAALRERGITIMDSKLERVLEAQRNVVPDCVAVGVVDLHEGVLLAYKLTNSHPQEIIDLLGAQTAQLFCGPVVRQIEDLFCKTRGVEWTAPMFKLFTAETDNFLHVWRRGARHTMKAIVFVCRASANIGMVKVQSKHAADAIELAI